MKKIATTLTAMALTLVMVGCNGAGNEQKNGVVAQDEESSEEVVIQGEIAWSDSEDAAAAAENAGFTGDFVVPYPLPIGDYEWSEPNFNSMDNVAEAHYNGKVVGVTIRKGEGVSLEDLSADLNEYNFDWTQDVDGIEVTCHGYEEGIANFLEWEADGCSYDVWCISTGDDNIGMSEEEVTAMVTSIK